MKTKEFNSNLAELSNIVISLNQLLYEILILISFHFLLSNIRDNPNAPNSIDKNTKSFIILVIILVVAVDWFIWNNPIQTVFFLCILAVYIYYNLQNIAIISTFINLSKDIYNASPIIPEQPTQQSIKTNEPDSMSIPEIFLNANATPQPFNATTNETKEIHEVYKTDKPYVSITDTKYAEIMLNELYTTPQYRNIQIDEIDTSLDNNLHLPPKTVSNAELINSFRNPKKEFLDKTWLSSPRTYNDNCVSCSHPPYNKQSNTSIKAGSKNAICTVVPFGRQLSECTNQDNTISPQQLENISENKVLPLQL